MTEQEFESMIKASAKDIEKGNLYSLDKIYKEIINADKDKDDPVPNSETLEAMK